MENANMVIYNLKLANFLLKRGHTINGIKQNRNNSFLLVFHFDIDETIYQDVHEYNKRKRVPN